MLIALALQAAAAQPAPQRPWAEFSRSPGLARRSDRAELFLGEFDRGLNRRVHRVRLIRRVFDREGERRLDEASCPALPEAVAALKNVPLPRPKLPGGDVVVVMDGVSYAVTLPFSYDFTSGDAMTLRSNVETPLAAWVDAQFGRLAACMPPEP